MSVFRSDKGFLGSVVVTGDDVGTDTVTKGSIVFSQIKKRINKFHKIQNINTLWKD